MTSSKTPRVDDWIRRHLVVIVVLLAIISNGGILFFLVDFTAAVREQTKAQRCNSTVLVVPPDDPRGREEALRRCDR